MTTLTKQRPKVRSAADWLKLAPVMDALVVQYKTPAYILNDPIQIPHRFADDPKACELVAFITALFSYGRRDLIIETVSNLFRITDDDPVGFLESYNPKRDAKLFKHFVYRFNKGGDVAYLWERLQWAYREFGSLEALFGEAIQTSPVERAGDSNLKAGIAGFTDQLLGENPPDTYGLKFLFAHPDKGGACKRFNMFLRWMVRCDAEPSSLRRQDAGPSNPTRDDSEPSTLTKQDAEPSDPTGQDTKASGRVDFGLWKNALTPADLLVPLDTHILKMNRNLGLSTRTDASWHTAEEVTDVFRLLCPEDPVKYDYALFGFSLDKRSPEEILGGS